MTCGGRIWGEFKAVVGCEVSHGGRTKRKKIGPT